MILIGMFDSPFVRRVAVSMTVLAMSFEHRNWSVGADFDNIREFNPLGRVPVLVLDDGESLVESAMILDYLDDVVGPSRALLPASGPSRRHALQLIALSLGAVDKALAIAGESAFRPPERRHPPYLARCETQLRGAFDALERACAARADHAYLTSDRIQQPDITLACVARYAAEAARIDLAAWPALSIRCARTESLDVFRRFYAPFEAPVT
jgi:glutathione S-transferase|nr:glutathione S-transferase N-terminal domain-containing protein [Kofleriaceae bacterium]